MRAVYYEQFGQAPRIENVPDPAPGPEGVVVKVEAIMQEKTRELTAGLPIPPGMKLPF